MNGRDDNLKQLSNLLDPYMFAKILEKNYSDRTLDFISSYAPTAVVFASTRYSPRTVDELIHACDTRLIDNFDVMQIAHSSVNSNRNERDLVAFLESIDKELPRRTAVNLFVAENDTQKTYRELAEFVKSGAYYAGDKGLFLDPGLAREMAALGLTLTSEYSGEHLSTFKDIDAALAEGDRMRFDDHRMAAAIFKKMEQPDWLRFSEYLKSNMGENIGKLTPYILEQKYSDFQVNRDMSKLADKVAGEYEQYIADLKQGDPDRIIKSAYEIYNKDYIVDFCNTNMTSLSPDDLQVLLDTDNVLDEIYQEWDTMTQLHGVAEIDTAIEDTAYRLRTAQAVKQMMEQKQKQELSESKVIADKPGIPKPAKHRGR